MLERDSIVVYITRENLFVEGLPRGSVQVVPGLEPKKDLAFGPKNKFWVDVSKALSDGIVFIRNQKGDAVKQGGFFGNACKIDFDAYLNQDNLCIGLFGTCGESKWRNAFIEKYEQLGITFFNPQVENWNPECAVAEAWHLANDRIILFPITNETYSTGSLAETGFSILQAIRLDDRRQFVISIEQSLEESLKENKTAAKESLRARALVSEHLKKLRLSNLYVVDSLEEMLEVSTQLYNAEKVLAPLRRFNPQD